MSKRIEIRPGDKFARWEVIREGEQAPRRHRQFWCRCSCEAAPERLLLLLNLRHGRSRSCGCVRRDESHKVRRRHTHLRTHTPEYRAWSSMKDRCLRPGASGFSDYGGRGISVCERWAKSFENFLEDLGEKPSAKHSLDRIDVNGNYCKENCRWATPQEQNANQRRSRLVTMSGETKTIAEWAAQIGVHRNSVYARIKAGWTPEGAVMTPKGGSKR